MSRLGNQAGMAASYGELGLLRAQTGAPREAVGYQLQSLAIRVLLEMSDAGQNVADLVEQRRMLGADAFLAAVREHAGEDFAHKLMDLLDQAE